MRRAAAVLLLAAAALPGAAAAQDRDVPYYIERPAERRALSRRCQADAALAATRECQNARAAGAVEMRRRSAPSSDWRLLPEFDGPAPPRAFEPRPVRRGAVRAT